MTHRVLHIIDQYKIGGPGKTILNSARFIDKERYEIHVATFLPDGAGHTELSHKISAEKIPLLYLRDVRGLSLDNLVRLRAYIRRHQISIFHCHGYKSEFYAYLLKLFYGGPVLVGTYHGWITNNWSQKAIVKATQLFSFFFDGIITVADDLLQKLPRTTKAWTTCCVIHNAIVLDDYPQGGCRAAIRKRYGIGDDEFVLGVVGRLSLEKGCFEAIDALVHLQRHSITARLMMIGDGPLRHALAQYAQRQGVNEQVVFTGHVHPVKPLYEALDIVVSPSYTEGISNVILEAMALRKPVVATSVGGTPEIIATNRNGILVPPRDAAALANAVAAIVRDPDLKQRLIQNGYATLISHFEFRQRMRKMESFYGDILTSKDRRANVRPELR